MKYDKKRMMTNKKPNWWLVEDNPTPVQIKNRIIMRRKWRKIKKALTPDDIIFPMLLAMVVLGLVGYGAVQLSLRGM